MNFQFKEFIILNDYKPQKIPTTTRTFIRRTMSEVDQTKHMTLNTVDSGTQHLELESLSFKAQHQYLYEFERM